MREMLHVTLLASIVAIALASCVPAAARSEVVAPPALGRPESCPRLACEYDFGPETSKCGSAGEIAARACSATLTLEPCKMVPREEQTSCLIACQERLLKMGGPQVEQAAQLCAKNVENIPAQSATVCVLSFPPNSPCNRRISELRVQCLERCKEIRESLRAR